MNSFIVSLLNKFEAPLIIGSFPPPLGGVSVHIYRLSRLVSNSTVFDTSVGGMWKYYKLFRNIMFGSFDVLHLHVLTLKIFVVVYFVRLFRKFEIITTDHNSRLFSEYSGLQRSLLRYFLGNVDYKLVVGGQIKESYLSNGVRRADDTIVSNSFIIPPLGDEEEILASYPGEYSEFLKWHSPVITTSAYQIVFIDGVDLYGFDMCIDLMYHLKNDYPDTGLVLFLANEKMHAEYFKELKEKIEEYGLGGDILFVTGQRELWPMYKHMDLMVRPTYSDGFGVSVAEAIYLGCPALASDVCQRAVGTHLFRNRDQNDFYQQTKSILSLRFGPALGQNDD